MTFLVADRVQETTNSPGTGTATLLGAVSGYQSFSTGIGANNTTFYVIADQLGTNWEVGLGAINSTGTVLTRTTVYSSSNGGSTVNFATGTQYVWCDFPSSKAVIQGTAVNFSSIGATTAGTGAFTTLSASSTVSGAGFSNYFAAPPTIGNTTPNTGAFTNLSYTGTLTGSTGIVNLGSGQFYKDASGNVGIGTSSPYVPLQVTGTIKVATGNAQGILSLGDGNGASTNCGVYRGAAGAPTTDGNYLNIGGYDGVVFTTGNAAIASQTERMRINSTGYLLIGTTANSGIDTGYQRLVVTGVSGGNGGAIGSISDSVGRNIIIADSSLVNVGALNINSTTMTLGTNTNNPLSFSTNATERMRIDSSGNLLVGGTTATGKNYTYQSANSIGIGVETTGGSYTSNAFQTGVYGTAGSSAFNHIACKNSSAATIFAVRGDGYVYTPNLGAATGTAIVLNANGFLYTLSSSIRYKKDVAPIDIGLNFILGLNPVKYNLKENDEPQVGFIAEDFPDARLVSMSRIDKEDEAKGFQAESVNYAQIVAPLVKAIQEQQALITDLTTRLTALEGK